MNTFSGWPGHTYTYLEGLEQNNNRDWYNDHKAERTEIERASRTFLEVIAQEGDTTKIFRLQRDARFSQGLPPYKTTHRAGIMRADGIVAWIDIDPTGLSTGIGHPQWDKTQLQNYRHAVGHTHLANELLTALRAATDAGLAPDPAELKRPQSGLPADHPEPDLTRHKHLTISRHHRRPSWANSPQAVHQIESDWNASTGVCAWLIEHTTASSPRV